MKVDPSIEDSFIPMEAKDIDTLQDHKRLRNEHWARVRRAREESDLNHNYIDWLEEKWGLRLHLSADGMITDDYTVVDEKKYLIYLLKFG